ncbi:MAG: CBS domain-containing protein [Oscillospiraceae bacterium]|nr:CBS domain-containing protein [Oscillospiraceae bacterium]
MFVRNKMTTNPFVISPDQTIPDAHEIMQQYGVKRLPVVKKGKLVGVVSKEDIAHASPSKATSFSVGEITYLLAKTRISKVMTKNPYTISPDALLEEAATLMRDHDVGFLPVVEGDKLVGIITQSDILDSFIDILGFRDPGTRMTIEANDEPGMIAKVAGIISEYDANITHMAVYRGGTGRSIMVIGINSQNTAELEQTIKDAGFDLLYKSVIK